MLNNNPVLVAKHFQYKVELFFKEIIVDGPLGKTKNYAIHIEFQERGSPHVHSLFGFSVHQAFQMRMSTSSFFEKTMSSCQTI